MALACPKYESTDFIYDAEYPDISHIITEDDTPVDNWFSEKQMRLLADSLNLSWKPGRPFLAGTDIGIFYGIHTPPIVPDVFLSLDVQLPENIWEKRHRSYFTWEYCKIPEVVIEIVSNTEGEERGRKYNIYEQIRVLYYVVYDPMKMIQNEPLRIFELTAAGYVPRIDKTLPQVGLKLMLWNGVYENRNDCWLRWCDAEGNLLLTGRELSESERQRAEQEWQRAEQERQRAETAEQCAEQERQRAEQERQRAEQERQRAERLVQKLKELGIEPD